MADKVKSFFQKKATNAKFINAGKGYKLTDSTSKVCTMEPKEPIKRAEPTEEAKIAGQAALARLEAKKTDKPRFNTSYAAIQARVKRELELERKAQQELQQTEDANEKKNKAVDPNIFAVTDVFFRCPYLSDEILLRDEWKKKIREFLYEQLMGEEAGLTACLIIQNCNTGKEKIDSCVETLGKYLENIINNPNVEKYWKIRMCNKIFQEKVLPVEGALEFLKAAGFDQKKILHNENKEDFLVWNSDNCIENLIILDEALRSAEPIPLELDRNLQVLMPNQARIRNELPPSFFTITPEEIKREQQLRTEAVERNQMLRTKAMRERDEQRVLRKYKFAVLRIKFPDGIILQGTFSVHEKFQNVIEFVAENLVDDKVPFLLVTPVDGTKLVEECHEKTLLELRLIPTAVLEFSWNVNDKESMPTNYLKEEILSYIQPV